MRRIRLLINRIFSSSVDFVWATCYKTADSKPAVKIDTVLSADRQIAFAVSGTGESGTRT